MAFSKSKLVHLHLVREKQQVAVLNLVLLSALLRFQDMLCRLTGQRSQTLGLLSPV